MSLFARVDEVGQKCLCNIYLFVYSTRDARSLLLSGAGGIDESPMLGSYAFVSVEIGKYFMSSMSEFDRCEKKHGKQYNRWTLSLVLVMR